jgi:hypothetical protein
LSIRYVLLSYIDVKKALKAKQVVPFSAFKAFVLTYFHYINHIITAIVFPMLSEQRRLKHQYLPDSYRLPEQY